MRGRCLIGAVGVLLALLVPGSSAVAAGSESPLVFAAGYTLRATWPELAAGKKFEVCNDTRAKLQPRPKLSEFSFVDKKAKPEAPVPTAKVLTAPFAPKVLNRGQCGHLEVKTVAGSELSGSFNGVALLLTADGVSSAELQISDSPPPPTPKVSGATEQVRLSAVNSFPWSDGELQDGGDLLLKEPLPDEGKLTVGSTCVRVGEDIEPPPSCPLLGNLYNGDDAVHVYVAGPPKVETGVVDLPVRIWPHAHVVGNYEGTLDPSGTGEEEELVKVKLTGSDSWWAVLIAVFLGALVALFAQLIAQRWRPRQRLEERRKKMPPPTGPRSTQLRCRSTST